MYVLWYCHKRGKETRLEREKSESGGGEPVEAGDRMEELPDDPALPGASTNPTIVEPAREGSDKLAPPPIGKNAKQ